jgi:hypothetical protein
MLKPAWTALALPDEEPEELPPEDEPLDEELLLEEEPEEELLLDSGQVGLLGLPVPQGLT